MAVLIRKEPNRIYQTYGGTVITEQDRKRADKLDSVLEQRIVRLLRELKKRKLLPDNVSKGNTETYFEVGKALRDVADNNDLLDKAEIPLFWQNANIYFPQELHYRDRGPYREHLWYCYRLAGYPKDLAYKMSWGEWVTIFDSTGINQEPRFDEWFKGKLDQRHQRVSRNWIRLFAPCVNTMLGNIYTPDLKNEELFACYEAAWEIVRRALYSDERELTAKRKTLQSGIISSTKYLGKVMEGTFSPSEYADQILVGKKD